MYDWPIFGQMLGLGLNNQPDGEYMATAEEPCSIYRWIENPGLQLRL